LQDGRAVVVGGGHNGLVCAGYLARAGLRTLVLERRESPGGALATWQPERGVRVPAAAHTIGRLRGSIVHDLGLRARGLVPIRPSIRAFVPQTDGQGLALWTDVGRTAEGLERWSKADAVAYAPFDRKVEALEPWIERPVPYPGFPEPLDHKQMKSASKALDCIGCLCCYSACPVIALGDLTDFAGPAPLVQLGQTALDPRNDPIKVARSLSLTGIFNCVSCYKCEEVCPASIPIVTAVIEPLKERVDSEHIPAPRIRH
jgi:ferredoxin